MSIVDIIKKKRDGHNLTKDEIFSFVEGVWKEEIPDYQASALLMAVYFKGMSEDETYNLFDAMLCSGEQFDLSDIRGVKVDKHSTGGVGDKTSLILAPIVAACGVVVPMLSGRGLGHTGGTLDKLEAISGFNVNLDMERFKKILRANNCAMMGQTLRLAPVDRKLYALRDVTGTVECLPLIASSIMSKKMAEDLDGLVLDVKFGSGAFMKSFDDAKRLAQVLVMLGKRKGVKTRALITNMDQPLGTHIGNSLEIKEALDVLRGEGAHDLKALSLQLSAHMLLLGDRTQTLEEAVNMAERVLNSGEAFLKFRSLVALQDGDVKFIDNPLLLLENIKTKEILSPTEGYVSSLNAEKIGSAAVLLGAGRQKMEDAIDYGVGFVLNKKIGDFCHKDEPLATMYYRNESKVMNVENCFKEAFSFSKKQSKTPNLIVEVIGQ